MEEEIGRELSQSEDESKLERRTSHTHRSSKGSYRNIKSHVRSQLLHLGKRLIAENTVDSHNEALKIASIFLESIPPRGYVPEDLFTFIVSIFHIHYQDESCARLFTKFLSMAAATTPNLRPLVLEHSVRFLASRGDYDGVLEEIQRRCSEWNLEKHEIAKHYRWVAKNIDSFRDFEPENTSQEFKIELEDVLVTYLKHRRLPNFVLLAIYTEIYGSDGLRLINEYIQEFPKIFYLRINRIFLHIQHESLIPPNVLEDDILKLVPLSSYSLASFDFLWCLKSHVGTENLICTLFDAMVAVPHLKRVWELFFTALVEGVQTKGWDEVEKIIETILAGSTARIYNNFTPMGCILAKIPKDCTLYYLATAPFILKNMERFKELVNVVEM
ncbi:conserved hypothetical protein [Theileria equi strain WA]|uniref:Uncharacterized protein n=1 Tax=Theileria equi strain WA TaxID=1537102 RepID=L1LFD7_THEEQ|nr:conserved hypothetical protein [Theileria equi strain WA]EKX73989.1 conserved hypothetical protein [Theileria equi strain WA]|eukprot:XP_004833441.1 conserved hypothetical protein [Theileria equi strain WA]